MDIPVTVECYSGTRYGEEPRAFAWQREWIQIDAVEKRWRTPLGDNFLVRAKGDRKYHLVYDPQSNLWFLSSPFKEGAPWRG